MRKGAKALFFYFIKSATNTFCKLCRLCSCCNFVFLASCTFWIATTFFLYWTNCEVWLNESQLSAFFTSLILTNGITEPHKSWWNLRPCQRAKRMQYKLSFSCSDWHMQMKQFGHKAPKVVCHCWDLCKGWRNEARKYCFPDETIWVENWT